MRQIVDSTGMVQYYQSYEPYGDVLASAGQGGSNYGYASEWTDATGLQYLRARYYNTGVGRFLTRDTWAGDYYDPLSLNRWMYVQGNPVRYTDPSGMTKCDSSDPLLQYDCLLSPAQIHNLLGELVGRSIGNMNKVDAWSTVGDIRRRGTETAVVSPPGITWSPSASLNSSSELVDSQKVLDLDRDGEIEVEYGAWGDNLCGHSSAAIILENLTSETFLMQFFENFLGRDAQEAFELGAAIDKFRNDRGVTNIQYWVHEAQNRGHYDQDFQVYDYELSGRKYIFEQGYYLWLMELVQAKHYYIAHVDIRESISGLLVPKKPNQTLKVPHWVIVTGFSAQWDHSNVFSRYNWIRIMNPYHNREEYYWWGEFRASNNSVNGLEIWSE